ncbi:MAG: hypothetical protein IPH54_21830 [Rhodoferax sp.]|nr:hypothetical protein [Rhodoferax sp.]
MTTGSLYKHFSGKSDLFKTRDDHRRTKTRRACMPLWMRTQVGPSV